MSRPAAASHRPAPTWRRAGGHARLSTVVAAVALGMPAAAAPPLAGVVFAPGVAPPRVEFVASPSPPTRRPDEGLLVLDLEALESADAALELARSWRKRTGATLEVICWLRASSRGLAADAVGALTTAESPPCTRILVPR